MSNFFEILDEIENLFLSNPHDVPLLVDSLIELNSLIDNTNDEISHVLLNDLKREVLKQHLNNSN